MFGLFGLAALLALAWCLSAERWHIPYRVVLGGVALQNGLAVLLIKFPPATAFFFMLDDGVAALQKATDAGTVSYSATSAARRCPSPRSSRVPASSSRSRPSRWFW